MDLNILSDDSSDSEMKNMKNQLIEYGLNEDNLSKEEMCDLLKALNNSKSSINEDEIARHKVGTPSSSSTTLKRKYQKVCDRRMPWSLFTKTLSNSEKARVLSVYIKFTALNKYRQARLSPTFVDWPSPIQLADDSNNRLQSLRSTRSGRNVPVYADVDDDSSDLDFFVAKPKRRKISGDSVDGVYTNKVVSLKRKNSKEDNRPSKELKSDIDLAETQLIPLNM